MSFVNLKDVVANGIKTLFGTEPATDKSTASTNEDDKVTLPISYDLTIDPSEPELPAIGSEYFDSIVNKRAAERGQQREQRQQTPDQEAHTQDTSIQELEVHSRPVLSSTRNRDARKSNKRDRSSPEERRALGIPEKTPRDAVIVQIPTSPYETGDTDMIDMPSRYKRVTPHQPFNKGLKPVNTLDAQPRPKSNRDQLLERSLVGDTDQYNGTKQLSKHSPKQSKVSGNISANNTIRANDHTIPHKRPRVGPSPLAGTAKDHAIDLEETQEREPSHPIYADPSRGYPGFSDDKWPTGSRLVAHTPIQSDVEPPKRVSRMARRSQNGNGSMSDHAQDELDEEITQNFTKIARAQRVKEEGVQHSDRRLNPNNSRRLEQLNRQLDSSPDLVEQHSGTSGYFSNAPSIQGTSNHVRLPDESPDALQSDVHTTSETPTRRRLPLQHQTASAIADDIITSAKQTKQKSRQPAPKGKVMTYPLDAVLHPKVHGSDGYLLDLDYAAKSIQIVGNKGILVETILDIPLIGIQKIDFAPDSKKVNVHFRGGTSSVPNFLMDFSSLKPCADFLGAVQSVNNGIRLANKEQSYMEQVFENGPRKMKEASDYALTKSSRRDRSDDRDMFPKLGEERKAISTRRPRLVDKLDKPPDTTEDPSSSSIVITGADRSGERRTQATRQRPASGETKIYTDVENSSDKPKPSARTTRTTRSQGSKVQDSVLSRPDVYEGRTPWKRPLVYPANGKSCATVMYDDLKRLNDDEFLNDNLVALFIRYLQEHATPEALKRMHFFNSFFFEALTKERKSKSGINYDAVSRWTKKINIFKRDFVIVPVNESHHWFVMIICNLPRLKKAHDPEDQAEETDEVEEIAPPNSVRDDKTILSSDLPMASETAARESFQELSLDESTQELSVTNHRKGSRRKLKRALPKYDIDAPVIITLDSLDQPRSVTATALRSYIQALAADENQSHQAFQIDAKAEIKGMTGKGIPHQTNFSDCGLYLCMYLEQFMTDPTKFVQRILRREEVEQGWPTEIESGMLRDRLLGMIVELHKQQESKGRYDAVIPPIGSILVNMQIPEANQKHRRILEAKEHWQRQKENDEVEVLNSPPQRPVKQHASESDKTARIISSEPRNHVQDSAILIEEDVPSHRPEVTSRYFQTDQRSTENSFASTIPVVQLDTPEEMAGRIRRERSPEQSLIGIQTVSESISSGTDRRMSISTDFLSSDEPFRMKDFPEIPGSNTQPKSLKRKDKEGESRSKKKEQTPGKIHGRDVSYNDALDIAQEMIFSG